MYTAITTIDLAISKMIRNLIKKHTTTGVPALSPTAVLISRSQAYVWQSGRDAQFS
jgi:hypothetical protein